VLCKNTFAQRRNRLTTHFSERIPVVKHHMTVKSWSPYSCVADCPFHRMLGLCQLPAQVTLPRRWGIFMCSDWQAGRSWRPHVDSMTEDWFCFINQPFIEVFTIVLTRNYGLYPCSKWFQRFPVPATPTSDSHSVLCDVTATERRSVTSAGRHRDMGASDARLPSVFLDSCWTLVIGR